MQRALPVHALISPWAGSCLRAMLQWAWSPAPTPDRGRRLGAGEEQLAGKNGSTRRAGGPAQRTVEASETRGPGNPGQRGGDSRKRDQNFPGRRRNNSPFHAFFCLVQISYKEPTLLL